MKILVAGGGTAGHIHPALAIAEEIRRRHPEAEFLFVGAKGRMEEQLVPAAGYPIRIMDVRGFQRKLTLKNIRRNIAAAYHAVAVGHECRALLREFQPDVAIGTGGYICGPILRQAARAGIPVILHESNAFPGMTVKMLAKQAAAVLVGDGAAEKYLPAGTNMIVTGNPVRKEFLTLDKISARQELGLDGRPVVFAVGGSLGARTVNEAMCEVLVRNQQAGTPLQIIHSAGKAGYDSTRARLEEAGVRLDGPAVRLRGFVDDMPRCMAAADLIVSRCGAMTLSELPAAGKPSVLIPSPFVADNHQYYNAMALADKGAAVCLEEKDLSGEKLWQTLCEITGDPARLQKMAACARAAAVTDATERIYDAIRPYLPV